MKRFSSRAPSPPAGKASRVVMLDGTLREFYPGATASYAIEAESDCVIFDTDKLHVGECISQMAPEAELDPGHIYMLLPQSMLNHRLDSMDMEKLAVKVKEALLMAAVERKFERSGSFCGLREMLPGKEPGGKVTWEGPMIKKEGSGKRNRVEANKNLESGKGNMNKGGGEGKKEKKKGERKESKCQYVWYLGFASLPIEDEN